MGHNPEDHYGMPPRRPLPMDMGLFAPSVPVSTSEAAADRQEEPDAQKKAAKDRLTLLRLIARTESGATLDELEVQSGLAGNTIRPRIREMREAGLGWVEVSGTITRMTRTQSPARVLFVTTKGRAHLMALRGTR